MAYDKTIMISPWPFWRYWYVSERRLPSLPQVSWGGFLLGLFTDFSSLGFIVLIYLVWKLSPRDTIPLEVSLSFKQTLQLSTSLMTTSISIVLSSLSGMALRVGNAAGGWFPWNLIFPFLILQCPRKVYGGGLPFSCYGKYPPSSPLFCIQGLSPGKQQQ